MDSIPGRLNVNYRLTQPVQVRNESELTILMRRLEAATSRLEDIASSSLDGQPQPASASTVQSGPFSAAPSAPPALQAPVAPKAQSVPKEIEAFDALIKGDVKSWVSLSEKMDKVLAEQASAVSAAFEAERTFLLVATKAKKPDMASSTFMDVLKDVHHTIEQTDEIKNSNRGQLNNQLTMVADGMNALRWITMSEGKPSELVQELFGGAQMYGNRVLQTFKESDPKQVEWVQGFYKIFRSLVAFIKEHYPKGVTWKKDGIDAKEAMAQVKAASTNGAAPAASAGGPPPPPPPPPLPTFDTSGPPPPPPPPTASRGAPAPDMGAVFDQLNRGSDVTKGLKKVDASQMTHKNPSLRAQAPVPERKGSDSSLGRGKSPAPPGRKPKPESMRTKKPPKKELDGNKWIIEHYDSPSSMVEIDVSLTQSIIISRCKNTTIRLNGKANAISIDNSSRLSIIIDNLVSSVDVIKCPNFALQVLGSLPTLLLDQVDGATVYLSKESLGTEIFSSKCSSVNITLPPEDEDSDYKECPAPEQIRSYVKDGQLVSEIVEHAG